MPPDRTKPLLDLAVEAPTAARYVVRIKAFVAWLSLFAAHTAFADLLERPEQLDDVVVEYLQHLWKSHSPRSWPGDLLSGLQHMRPRLRGHLRCSWRATAAWGVLEPCEFRTPWPVFILLAICNWLCRRGHFPAALGLLLAFHCLLRPGELCRLQLCHLMLPSQLRGISRRIGIVVIELPKTRRRAATRQHVIIEDGYLLDLLEWHCSRRRSPDARLFPSYARLKGLVAMAFTALGLPPTLFTLGGLRSGGATQHYLEHENLSQLLRRGRWSNVKTLDHYVQEAAVVLVMLTIPPEVLKTLNELAASLGTTLGHCLGGSRWI